MLFFGVAIRLYLFIDMPLSPEQKTCKVSFTCTRIGADSEENSVQLPNPRQSVNWRGETVSGCKPACSTKLSNQECVRLNEKICLLLLGTAVVAGYEKLYKMRITVPSLRAFLCVVVNA